MSTTDDIVTCDPATSGEHEGAVTSWQYVYQHDIVCNNVINATVRCIHCARSHSVFFNRVVPRYHWYWVRKALRDYQKALKLC